MPLFVMIGTDGPAAREQRPTVRPAHLAHWQALDEAGHLKFGGPLLDAAGQPRGSLLVFESDDLASARAHAEGDPYVTSGVFGRFELHETRAVFPSHHPLR